MKIFVSPGTNMLVMLSTSALSHIERLNVLQKYVMAAGEAVQRRRDTARLQTMINFVTGVRDRLTAASVGEACPSPCTAFIAHEPRRQLLAWLSRRAGTSILLSPIAIQLARLRLAALLHVQPPSPSRAHHAVRLGANVASLGRRRQLGTSPSRLPAAHLN